MINMKNLMVDLLMDAELRDMADGFGPLDLVVEFDDDLNEVGPRWDERED